MEKFIGVDIGGTNTKIGIVSRDGEILEKAKYPTTELSEGKGYIENFAKVLKKHLNDHPEIKSIGIGIPGLISKDRRTLLRLANIPSLSGVPIVEELEKRFPEYKIKLENDAKVACLGEYYFSKEDLSGDFLMVTLGTGIGGAAIIDGKLFVGANGNGVEVGHMLGAKDKIYEDYISKRAMVAYAKKKLKEAEYKESVLHEVPLAELTSKHIEEALAQQDPLAKKVFKYFGKWLGRCLVSSIRVLDIHTILLGGGVSKTFKAMKESMYDEISEHLGPYYMEDLQIKKASLGNNAGIIGAAALNFED